VILIIQFTAFFGALKTLFLPRDSLVPESGKAHQPLARQRWNVPDNPLVP
jgi:hypothetical protein